MAKTKKAAPRLPGLGGLAEAENRPGLLLASFLSRPVGLQFGRQLRFGCPTHCLLLGPCSGFDGLRRQFSSPKIRPSCFLSSANLLFHRSAHGPASLWCSSKIGGRTEDAAELFVQSLELFFNRGSPLELVNGQVECIHGVCNYHSKWVEIKRRPGATCRR